jgi:L-fuculose-phosphate aldolase
MEALVHQAGILFRTLILAHITGRDVPYLSGEALAGLVQIRDEMGILTGGIPEN